MMFATLRNSYRICLLSSMAVLLSACTATGFDSVTTSSRPDADIARDADRKPYMVLNFLGVEPGMTALDVIAAGGYYTEVLSGVVGPNGRVYAQNPAAVLRYFDGNNDRVLNQRLMANRLPNVRRLDREFDDLGLVAGSVDVAITALNFHDIYNNSPQAAAGVLLAIKQVLKPGGVLGIIDHVGEPELDNAALHRIDPGLVIAAAEQAGFSVTRSDLLANPDDDHRQGPFAPGMRGKTDRFLLKLTKPPEA